MVAGHEPFYPKLHDTRDWEEIRRRVLEKEFPGVSKLLVLGAVVAKCWHLEYETMEDL